MHRKPPRMTDMSVPDTLVSLDDDGIAEACRQTYPLWHQGLEPDAYELRLRESFSRMGRQMRYVGLHDTDGALAASARWLELDIWLDSALRPTVGIAAVYVREDLRGAGWGRRLIRAILAAANQAGRELALLFSDIGHRYYQEQGFVPLPALDWAAATADIPPERPLRVRPADMSEHAWMVEMFNRRACGSAACPVRTSVWWRHYRWWREAAPDLALYDGERRAGYATVRFEGNAMRVFEWVAPEVEPARVWATLRGEAERRGCERMMGWLQPDRRQPWATVVERSEGLPMIARTDGRPLVVASPAVFEALDHF